MTNYTIPVVNSLIDVLSIPNTFTGNLFWNIIILIIWLSIFVSFSRNNGRGLLVSFFICFILSSLLSWAGLVSVMVVGICLAGSVFSLLLEGGVKL